MLPRLTANTQVFPDPTTAWEDPPGLLAIGGDLDPERLIAAYRQGVFPWFGDGDPLLWWSPNPRALFYPPEVHISRSLRKFLRRQCNYQCTINQDFASVIHLCAAMRPEACWITPEMRHAYLQLHDLGHAHSIEVWQGPELVGGLYGVSVGSVFCGESMFHRADHASKVALLALATQLVPGGLQAIDCQLPNAHLESLGAVTAPRHQFLTLLKQNRDDIIPAAYWQPQKIPLPEIGN